MTQNRVLVWDLPTRAFHWLLAASFVGAFVTAESDRLMDLHLAFGYTMIGLIAFRLLWGVVGTRYARFRSFAFGPRAVLAYIKSIVTFSPQHHVGHNPAGSWAIYALIALSLLAGLTGYANYSEIGGAWVGEAHEAVANTLMAVVLVHIAGVVVSSLLHRENLARAMVSGYKSGAPEEGIRGRRRFVAAALVLAVLGSWLSAWDVLPSFGSAPSFAAAPRHDARERHH